MLATRGHYSIDLIAGAAVACWLAPWARAIDGYHHGRGNRLLGEKGRSGDRRRRGRRTRRRIEGQHGEMEGWFDTLCACSLLTFALLSLLVSVSYLSGSLAFGPGLSPALLAFAVHESAFAVCGVLLPRLATRLGANSLAQGRKSASQSRLLRQLAVKHLLLFGLSLLSSPQFGPASDASVVVITDGHAPSILAGCLQLLFFACVEDTLYYWGHRMLHTHALYALLHQHHHQSVDVCVWDAENTHPIELSIGALAFSAGPACLAWLCRYQHEWRCHLSTYLAWTALRTAHNMATHMGFEIPQVPLAGWIIATASQHDDHHKRRVVHYGSFFQLWDWLCGTHMLERPRLLRITDMPQALRVRDINSGYRWNFTPITAARSLFQGHNEVGNVWTSLVVLPFLLAEARSIWDQHQQQEHHDSDTWGSRNAVLGLFFLTALSLHLCSAVFHLFFCVSLRWARALALLDWSMIVIWLHVSSLPTLYWLLPPVQRWPHLLSSAAVLATWAYCAWVDARALARFGVRSTLLIALSVMIRLFPELRVLLSPIAQTGDHYPWLLACSLALYVSGIIVYALRVPERWRPGAFDVWGHSHQISHLLFDVATYSMIKSVRELVAMDSSK